MSSHCGNFSRRSQGKGTLDPGSSALFVTEGLSQSCHLRHLTLKSRIGGIVGITHNDKKQAITQFLIQSVCSDISCERDILLLLMK